MREMLLLATAWGAKHGGINVFNMDFAIALAAYLRPSGRVFCAVLDASPDERQHAQREGVILVPIDQDVHSSSYDEAWADTVWEELQKLHPGTLIDWWIGHDVTSAAAALKGPQVARHGRTALIMHMNYADYAGYKHGSGAEAARKERRQRDLFKRADKCFAVGPLLRDALRDIVDGEVTMLVPGFAEVPIRPGKHRLTVITFGRKDRESDRIKQGGLAVAGFASAIREAWTRRGMPRLLRANPRMRVIGISEEKGDEEKALRQLACEKAGRQMNLLAQPFDDDRDKLFEQLGRANIALMPSWHEGFGLTGWEAIAAEVPLIVSKESGLYKLVDDPALDGLGTACVYAIDVQGQEGRDEISNFTASDEVAVRDMILEVVSDLPVARRKASRLKEILQDQFVCTWENTAHQFWCALAGKPQRSRPPGVTSAQLLGRASQPRTDPEEEQGSEELIASRTHSALAEEFEAAARRRDIASLGRLLPLLREDLPRPRLAEAAILVGDVETWRQASGTNDRSALFWRGRGLCLCGDYCDGIKCLLDAMSGSHTGPDETELLRNIANALGDLGYLSLSMTILDRLYTFIADDMESHAQIKLFTDLARAHARSGAHSEADEFSSKAIRLCQETNNVWREQIIAIDIQRRYLISQLDPTIPLTRRDPEWLGRRLKSINREIRNTHGQLSYKINRALEQLVVGDSLSGVKMLRHVVSEAEAHPFLFYVCYEASSLVERYFKDVSAERKRERFYMEKMASEVEAVRSLLQRDDRLRKWQN